MSCPYLTRFVALAARDHGDDNTGFTLHNNHKTPETRRMSLLRHVIVSLSIVH